MQLLKILPEWNFVNNIGNVYLCIPAMYLDVSRFGGNENLTFFHLGSLA